MMANPEKLHADTYPNRKSPYESVAEQMAAEAEVLDAWFNRPPRLVWAGDGGLSWDCAQDLAWIPDPRKPERIKHQRVVVPIFAVLLFLTLWTSRREGNRQLTEPQSGTTL